MSPELLRYKFVEVLEAESLLIERVTYESFAEAWPKRSGAFADKMNAMPKHVVSTTLKQPSWNSAVIAADVVPAITKLREADGGPILVEGSRTLIHTLMAHNLVSEYRIIMFPVILGSGRRLFPETPDRTGLRLTESCTFSSGVVVQTYTRPSSETRR